MKKTIGYLTIVIFFSGLLGALSFGLFKESFFSGFLSGILICLFYLLCYSITKIIDWAFSEDKKPKGYKEEGTLEITSGEYLGTCGSCKYYLRGTCRIAPIGKEIKLQTNKCDLKVKDVYQYEEIH